MSQWRLEFGEFLLHRENFAKALAEFHAAVRIDSSLIGPASVGIASVMIKEGKLSEAEKVLREAIASGSHPVVVHNALGMLLLQQHRTDEAIQQFRNVLQIDLDLAAPHANLAIIFIRQAKPVEAVKHCRELMRIEPDATEVLWVLNEVCRQTDYSHPNYLELLSNAHAEIGQFEKAIDWAEKALKLAESSGDQALSANLRQNISVWKKHALVPAN